MPGRRYPEAFKRRLLRRLDEPGAPTIEALAAEEGVHKSTLARWRQKAARVADMSDNAEKPRRPEDWSAADKMRAIVETAELDTEALGRYLRRQGLHRHHLEQWREHMLMGLENRSKRPAASRKSAEGRRIRELERELRRKDAALAETAALIVLKKKAQALWGDEDDAIPPSSDS